ncbi:Ivy family c-type lysozyme inhibitor [Rhizobium lusitanum]
MAQKVHVMSACKQHNCGSERIAVMYNTEMR